LDSESDDSSEGEEEQAGEVTWEKVTTVSQDERSKKYGAK
jgi:hypothetical protein